MGGGGQVGRSGGVLKFSMETRKNHKKNPSLVRNISLVRNERSMPEKSLQGCGKFPILNRGIFYLCTSSAAPQIPLYAGIEPRTVAISALAVRRSSHSATSHPNSTTSHPQLGYISSTNRLHLIHSRLHLIHHTEALGGWRSSFGVCGKVHWLGRLSAVSLILDSNICRAP
jgi:hypothetical protein